MAGGPALALMHASPPPASAPAHVLRDEVQLAASAPEPRPVDNRVSRSDAPVPTEPPTTVAMTETPTTVARVRAPARTTPSTTIVRRTTTTVRTTPKPTTAPAKPAPKPSSSSPAPAPSGRSQSGGATWYDAAPSGTCAHKTLPMGTVVTIRSSSGATASCTVSDRGPYADGMIIDLAKDVFQRLAPLSQGVVQVTISW